MTDLAWMKTYIGDEAALTGHLTAEEFGAYERLRRHYWQHGSIPDDDARLIRITAVDPAHWLSVRQSIELILDARQLDRLDRERATAADKRERKVAAGQKGAEKRWGDRRQDSITNGNTNGTSNGYANSKPMADAIAEPLVTQWPPAPAPDSQAYEKNVELDARTRTPTREEPAPVEKRPSHPNMFTDTYPAMGAEDGKAFLVGKGVPQRNMMECLQVLMGGNLTRYELEGYGGRP